MIDSVKIEVIGPSGLKEQEELLVSQEEIKGGTTASIDLFTDIIWIAHAQAVRVSLTIQVPGNKPADWGILLSAIRRQLKKTLSKNEFDGLTKREKEVCELLLHGYTSKEIAHRLFISLETVRSHRKNILFKMNARNIANLSQMVHPRYKRSR